MQTLTKNEAIKWCGSHGVALDERGRPAKPEDAESFPVPADTGRKIALVAGELHGFEPVEEYLVWVTDWGVWPSSERPHIFDRFRASYGEHRTLVDVPAHVFRTGEYEDAQSLVTLCVLFLWDVFVVGTGGATLHFSHDEHGWVGGRGSRRTSGCS
jgi:hypothetical protein